MRSRSDKRHQARKIAQGLFQILGLLGHQDRAVVREIGGERHAEAVQDEAAGRWQQPQVDAVFVGQQAILLRLDDLQVIEARNERSHQRRLHAAQNHRPTGKDLRLVLCLLFVTSHGAISIGRQQPTLNPCKHEASAG